MLKPSAIVVLLASFPVLRTAGFAQAAESPPDVRAIVQALAAEDRQFLAGARYAGKYAQSRLVSFSTRGPRLVAEFHLPDDLAKQFADPAPLIIHLEGSPHLWSLHRRKSGTLDRGLSMICLTCYAPTDAGPFQRFAIASDGKSLTVTARQTIGRPPWQNELLLAQSDRGFVAAFRLEHDKYAPRRMELAEFWQLPIRSPQLVEYCVAPVLRRLGPGRAGADVYRVFEHIPADPRATRSTLPLVLKLGADDAGERDAAVRELRRSGRPAMLATLRLIATGVALAPEQKSRLASYWAADGWLRVEDVQAARRDERFLESCLEDEDPAVRVAAANSLAAIRTAKALGR